MVVHFNHKPFHAITKKSLHRAPKRLQSKLVGAIVYDIEVKYLEGKKMLLADRLSRAYINNTKPRESEFESVNAINYLPMHAERNSNIHMKTQEDTILSSLKTTIQHGWPDKGEFLLQICQFFNQRDEFTVADGLIFRGERLVIPKELRKSVFSELHVGHTVIDGSLCRAHVIVHWLGITNDVREHTQECETCCEFDTIKSQRTTHES